MDGADSFQLKEEEEAEYLPKFVSNICETDLRVVSTYTGRQSAAATMLVVIPFKFDSIIAPYRQSVMVYFVIALSMIMFI